MKNETILIQLVDGTKIVDFDCDQYSFDGCETCDYGSEYVTKFKVMYEYDFFEVKCSQMHEYGINIAFLIGLFLLNNEHIKTLCKEDFESWLLNKFSRQCDLCELYR